MGMQSALDDVRRRLDLETVDWADSTRCSPGRGPRRAGYSLVRWRNVVPERTSADVARSTATS
jgi:hypothetical protein